MKTFEIKQCALDLGGVYELVLLEDGVNAGGRVPPQVQAGIQAVVVS